MPIRRLLPLLIVNPLVIATVAMVIVKNPSHARAAGLFMLLLFAGNFVFIRRLQKKYAEDLASGTAAPPSPATKRIAMWGFGLWGVVSYVSGVFNLPLLFAQREIGPWLGWAVKMMIGTLCIWCALRVRKSLNSASSAPGRN